MINPVSLLCDLAEAEDSYFSATDSQEQYKNSLDILIANGAILSGSSPQVVACQACHEDHPALIEYDYEIGKSFYFCPIAGQMWIDKNHLRTFSFDVDWLINWLIEALPVHRSAQRRCLMQDRLWYLGDAKYGKTELTVTFSRRVMNVSALGEVTVHLKAYPSASIGLVITRLRTH